MAMKPKDQLGPLSCIFKCPVKMGSLPVAGELREQPPSSLYIPIFDATAKEELLDHVAG